MSAFVLQQEILPGVYELSSSCFVDHRGSFLKTFHAPSFIELGLDFVPVESFVSKSSLNVLRGMHFQSGKAAQKKLVYCLRGSILDVVVDPRRDSQYFNKPVSVSLEEDSGKALLIDSHYAHGFLSLSDNSLLLYYTTTVHCPDLDNGVLWSSIDFDWPITNPLLSTRDLIHPSIHDIL